MNNNIEALAAQLKAQQRTIRRGAIVISGLFLAFLLFLLSSFGNSNERKVIRAKGIVIVDDNGRDRILIGAPFPSSPQRIRTDFEASKKTWAERFNGQFDWYKTNPSITHGGAGMLILDENGHDRLSVGAPSPSSWIGRIAPLTGITINDYNGSERAGFGLISGEGYDRVVLGLDQKSGYEGATLSVMEDGSTSLSLSDPDNRNRIQLLNDKGMLSDGEPFPPQMSGLLLKDRKGKVKTMLDATPAMPVFLMKDTSALKK